MTLSDWECILHKRVGFFCFCFFVSFAEFRIRLDRDDRDGRGVDFRVDAT